jgi:hypothetical protein
MPPDFLPQKPWHACTMLAANQEICASSLLQDSYTANEVMQVVKSLTKSGITIIVSDQDRQRLSNYPFAGNSLPGKVFLHAMMLRCLNLGGDTPICGLLATHLRYEHTPPRPMQATIHAPSQFTFSLFDRLAIVVRGRTVYFGDNGN